MEWKADWETRFRPHTWLTIFRPTRKGVLVHEARFTGWPVARAVIGRAKKLFEDLESQLKRRAPGAAGAKPGAEGALPMGQASQPEIPQSKEH
ncbi:MAG: hypothetical protein NVS4B10_25960 [Myxococcales bacterium]